MCKDYSTAGRDCHDEGNWASPDLGSVQEYAGEELAALKEAGNYYRWILRTFSPFLRKRVLEVGAGIGTFSERLLGQAQVGELTLIEPSERLFSSLHQRFAGNERVKLVRGYLNEVIPSNSTDSIVLVNVLEHVSDDSQVLAQARRILSPDGTLLIFVPALRWLYGSLDRTFDHLRRYTGDSLAGLLKAAGFRLICLHYFNFPGVFTWFAAGRVLRRSRIRPIDVRIYDRWVVPWASWIEGHWNPPIGQSLVAVGDKGSSE